MNNKPIEKIIENVFIKHGWIQRLDKDAITGPVEIMQDIDEIANAIKNKYRSKIKRLRENTKAWQCIADRRRDYANHLSVVLRDKNKRIKELSDIKIIERKLNE